MQHDIIARFARCGYTLRPCADGYELAGYSPPPCPRCEHRHPAGERCQALPPGAYWTPGPDGAWYVARVAVMVRKHKRAGYDYSEGV